MLNVLYCPVLCVSQVLVVMDGIDKFCYQLKFPQVLPSAHAAAASHQYLFAGGAVSPHTSEKHIFLVKAENAKLSWKLSSLTLLNGIRSYLAAVDVMLPKDDTSCCIRRCITYNGLPLIWPPLGPVKVS